MVDLRRAKLVPLVEAGKFFPGQPPHENSLHRWHRQGHRRSGVKLWAVKISNRRFTTEQAVMDFIRAMAESNDEATNVPRHAIASESRPATTGKSRKSLTKQIGR